MARHRFPAFGASPPMVAEVNNTVRPAGVHFRGFGHHPIAALGELTQFYRHGLCALSVATLSMAASGLVLRATVTTYRVTYCALGAAAKICNQPLHPETTSPLTC